MSDVFENIDKVRSSRDGHEFHERWAARRSLELIFPKDNLVAIAVEGLSVWDDTKADKPLDEIADLSLYYGSSPTLKDCTALEILQFKYSNSNKDVPATASYLKKTIKKFARNFKKRSPEGLSEQIKGRLSLVFITNRPLSADLTEAIDSIREGRAAKNYSASRQRKSIEKWCREENVLAVDIVKRLSLQSTGGNLGTQGNKLRHRVIDWSVANDYQAKTRLYALTQLMRDKAGGKGQQNNIITKEDVLGALGVDEPEDLLPAKDHFVNVGPVLERSELRNFATFVNASKIPVILHADGGVGKTVFLQDYAKRMDTDYEVIIFDCFGGGSYRQIEDGRHLPNVGLLHIINTIAARGLCDPILPSEADTRLLLKKARNRFEQATNAIREQSDKHGLLLIIDAFDNAVEEAKDRKQDAFPPLLIDIISCEPIDGLKLIGSARSHRWAKPLSEIEVAEFQLSPFDREETKHFIESRIESTTDLEIKWAYQRSGGNGRVLEYLVKTWGAQEMTAENSTQIEVEELIRDQVAKTSLELKRRNWNAEEIGIFFAALALLPPPVPIDEFANALEWEEAAVRSATSDLAPMLEQVPQGIIFRDEPTETYIRENFASNPAACDAITRRLLIAQKVSAYAGEALPRFLETTGGSLQAYELALTNQFPSEITTDFGRLRLRLARLRAALKLAALDKNKNQMVRLLAELARVQAANNRGDAYIREKPELAIVLGGPDTVRRLFHDRSGWRGARHGRLTIAYCFLSEFDEASIQADRVRGWISWYFRQEDNEEARSTDDRPNSEEFAALFFQRALAGQFSQIDTWLDGLNPRFSLDAAQRVVGLMATYQDTVDIPAFGALADFIKSGNLKSVAFLLALSSRRGLVSERKRHAVLKALSISKVDKVPTSKHDFQSSREFEKQVCYSSFTALVCGMKTHSRSILRRCELPTIASHDLTSDHWIGRGGIPILASCLKAWTNGRMVNYSDLLPQGAARKRGAKNITDRAAALVFLRKIENPRNPHHLKGKHQTKTNLFDQKDCDAICDAIDIVIDYIRLIEPWVLGKRSPTADDFRMIVKQWEKTGPRSKHRFERNARAEMKRQFGFELIMLIAIEIEGLEQKDLSALFSTAQQIGISTTQTTVLIEALSNAGLYLEPTAAEGLATAVAISKDEYVEQRGQSFIALAAACLPGSRADAQTHFDTGLELLDRMGAGDYEFVYSLIHFASAQRGGLLDGRLAQRFMNLCQVNFADEPHKFGWTALAKAMANSVGFDALSKLSRWNDQDVVEFSYGAPQLISSLVEKGHLSATLAVPLLWLTSDEGWHDWSLSDGLGTILAKLPEADRSTAAQSVLRRLWAERSDDGWPSTWKDLKLLEKNFPGCFTPKQLEDFDSLEISSTYQRDQWNTRNNSSGGREQDSSWRETRRKQEHDAKENFNALLLECPPDDGSKIDESINAVNKIEHFSGHSERGFLAALRGKCEMSQRPAHISTLSKLQAPDFSWLLEAIGECSEKWRETSAFVPKAVSDAVSELISLRGSDLFECIYGIGSQIIQLENLSKNRESTLLQIIEVVANERLDLSSDDWFLLATRLCKFADGSASFEALQSILSSPTVEIGDEIGEGKFQPKWHAPSDESQFVAELIWHRLGSDDTFIRWQAARLPTVLAELGLTKELTALAALIGSSSHSSLSLDNNNFTIDQAKQWLLIGLARAAYFFPDVVNTVREPLEALILKLDGHAIHLILAARTLDNIDRKSPGGTLGDQHISSLPHARLGEIERERKYSGLSDSINFEFDDHFERYDLDDLEQLFGISMDQSAQAVRREVQDRWKDASGMNYFGGHDRYGRGDEGFETTREQVARHALLHAASKLSITEKITESEYCSEKGNTWGSWLNKYDLTFENGLWLSDIKDKKPTLAKSYFLEAESHPEKIISDFGIVQEQLGLSGQCCKMGMPIYAYWSSLDGVYVRITSLLAPSIGSIGIADKIRKHDTHAVWLPGLDEDGTIDQYCGSNLDKRLTPWIWSKEHVHIGVDQYDKWAAKAAAWRPRLGPNIQRERGITATDAQAKLFIDENRHPATCSVVWGEWQGQGREKAPEDGTVLFADNDWLNRFLKETRQVVIMNVTLTKYISHTYGDNDRSLRKNWIVRRDETGHLRHWPCIARNIKTGR